MTQNVWRDVKPGLSPSLVLLVHYFRQFAQELNIAVCSCRPLSTCVSPSHKHNTHIAYIQPDLLLWHTSISSQSCKLLRLSWVDGITTMLYCAETLTFAADLKDEGFTVISYCPGWCVS